MVEADNVTVIKMNKTVEKNITHEEVEVNPSNITVTYSLWVGSNVSEKHSINVTVDRNETFYEIMERAAQMDSRYTLVLFQVFPMITYQISIPY